MWKPLARGNIDVCKLLDLHKGRSVALACCNPAANCFEYCDRNKPKYIFKIHVEAPSSGGDRLSISALACSQNSLANYSNGTLNMDSAGSTGSI